VQELFDQQVLGLLPAAAPQPPAYEQIHQQAHRRTADPSPDWYIPSTPTLRRLPLRSSRLAQPPVPDLYYRLRRASYEASMRAAADRLARRIDAAAAAASSPPGT